MKVKVECVFVLSIALLPRDRQTYAGVFVCNVRNVKTQACLRKLCAIRCTSPLFL